MNDENLFIVSDKPKNDDTLIFRSSSKDYYLLQYSKLVEFITAGITGAGMADSGANGLIKRTSFNVTTVAIAGVDYEPAISILPVNKGGTGTITPALVAGTNIIITGIWPNQTINSTGGGGGGLADPGTNGIMKRTALNTTATAVAGTDYEAPITIGSSAQYYRGDKTMQTLDKTAVGLANVDNTSDVNKPISTDTQTALNTKEGTITILSVAKGGTGTATPGLVQGTNITITGTWPNQTVNSSGGGTTITRAWTALTIAATTGLDATSSFEKNFKSTSALTTVTFSIPTNLADGDEINIDLFKTVAAGGNAAYTIFTNGIIITDGVGTSVAGQVVTLVGSSTSRFLFNIKRQGTDYFVTITRIVL